MLDNIVEKLLEFDEDGWVNFLNQLLFNLDPDPSLHPIAPERISQLFWIYNTLDETNRKTRLLYVKSLLHFLRNLSPKASNGKLVYDLIYFIHDSRPIEHRSFLELLIRDESFQDLYYGGDNLHLLLIKAYTNIEDKDQLFLEEYLLTSQYKREPYYLYLMTNYYGSLKHVEKALNAISEYLSEAHQANFGAEYCKEIYHALTDCIPKYINISDFLERFIGDDLKIGPSDSYLSSCMGKFVDDLKTHSENHGLALFAEDVLNGNLKNYLVSPEIDELAKTAKYNDLILTYVNRFIRRKRLKNAALNFDELAVEIVEEDPEATVEKVENYFSVAVAGM